MGIEPRPDDGRGMSLARKIAVTIAILALFTGLQLLPGWLESGTPAPDPAPAPSTLYIPRSILDPTWLEERGREQRERVDQSDLFTSFAFTDRLTQSRISFRHRIVDDSGKNYLPDHYDHGSGLATADVDEDGQPDLYFVNQAGGNQLWGNLGEGRFADRTTPALALADRVCVAASFADVDNDGDTDLFVTSVRGGNALFANDGNGGFADVTTAAGLDYRGHSSAALFFDYDRDGLLDLLVSNVGKYTRDGVVENSDGSLYYPGRRGAFSLHLKPEFSEPSRLYRNLGDRRFTDVTEVVGLIDSSWSGDAAALDANGDGWQDLYLLNMQGHDQYYENREGTGFVRKSRKTFPRTPWGSMGIQVFDWDNDGEMDIYVTDMHSDMSQGVDWRAEKEKSEVTYSEDYLQSGGMSIFGNAFYRGLRNGRFEEISDRVGAENYWPWGLSAGDVNADGWEDVFITASMNYPFRYGVNSLLLNDRGRRFLDSEFALGVEPRDRTNARFFALDCAGVDRMHRHCSGEMGPTVVHGARGSRASVLLDLEGDGDLDIVTNDFNSEPMVLVSDLSERKPDLRFLKIELVGSRSNRDGLGAVVSLQAGERTLTQLRDGRSGYLSQSLLPLYFGLGEAESVDVIEVRWPSGAEQRVTGPIAASQLIVIAEPP